MDRDEKIVIKRHEEVLGALGKVATALTGQQKDDPELKKLMSENRDAINNFTKEFSAFAPDVNVELNQSEVVQKLEGMKADIVASNQELMQVMREWIAESKRVKKATFTVPNDGRDYSGFIKKVEGEIK